MPVAMLWVKDFMAEESVGGKNPGLKFKVENFRVEMSCNLMIHVPFSGGSLMKILI